MVLFSWEIIFKIDFRSFPFGGINPSKQNLCVGRPLATNAVVAAQGPGMQMTLCPACMVAFTNSSPGSLITGSPASVIKAIVLPLLSNSRSVGILSYVLCL